MRPDPPPRGRRREVDAGSCRRGKREACAWIRPEEGHGPRRRWRAGEEVEGRGGACRGGREVGERERGEREVAAERERNREKEKEKKEKRGKKGKEKRGRKKKEKILLFN